MEPFLKLDFPLSLVFLIALNVKFHIQKILSKHKEGHTEEKNKNFHTCQARQGPLKYQGPQEIFGTNSSSSIS